MKTWAEEAENEALMTALDEVQVAMPEVRKLPYVIGRLNQYRGSEYIGRGTEGFVKKPQVEADGGIHEVYVDAKVRGSDRTVDDIKFTIMHEMEHIKQYQGSEDSANQFYMRQANLLGAVTKEQQVRALQDRDKIVAKAKELNFPSVGMGADDIKEILASIIPGSDTRNPAKDADMTLRTNSLLKALPAETTRFIAQNRNYAPVTKHDYTQPVMPSVIDKLLALFK